MAYLVAAYLVIWTLLFLFLVSIQRRQKQVQAEMEEIVRRSSQGPEDDAYSDPPTS